MQCSVKELRSNPYEAFPWLLSYVDVHCWLASKNYDHSFVLHVATHQVFATFPNLAFSLPQCFRKDQRRDFEQPSWVVTETYRYPASRHVSAAMQFFPQMLGSYALNTVTSKMGSLYTQITNLTDKTNRIDIVFNSGRHLTVLKYCSSQLLYGEMVPVPCYSQSMTKVILLKIPIRSDLDWILTQPTLQKCWKIDNHNNFNLNSTSYSGLERSTQAKPWHIMSITDYHRQLHANWWYYYGLEHRLLRRFGREVKILCR